MDFTSTFLKLINIDEVRVWRVSLRMRILCAFMAVAMLGVTVYVAVRASGDIMSPPGIALAALVVADAVMYRVLRYAFRSVTTAAPEGLIIRTGRLTRSRRKVVVPWQVIDGCKPGASGTTIECRDGRRVLAAVPQRVESSKGAHRKTEADYFALYVMERARLIREVAA